jgi:hypothetical protein
MILACVGVVVVLLLAALLQPPRKHLLPSAWTTCRGAANTVLRKWAGWTTGVAGMRAAVWAAWPAMATSSPLRGQVEPHRVPVPMRDWAVATGSSLGVLVALVTVVVVVTHWNRRERAVRTRPAVTPPPSSPPHGQDSLPQARPAPGGEAQPSHPDADALVTPHVQPGAPALGGSSTLTHINDWLSGGTLRSQVPVQSLPEQKAPCRQRSKAPCQGPRATPSAASARIASATEHDGPRVRAGNCITPVSSPNTAAHQLAPNAAQRAARAVPEQRFLRAQGSPVPCLEPAAASGMPKGVPAAVQGGQTVRNGVAYTVQGGTIQAGDWAYAYQWTAGPRSLLWQWSARLRASLYNLRSKR